MSPRRHAFALIAVLASFLVAGQPAVAVEPNEVLDDPVLEHRARELSKELRCVVCQNQSIDDSNAELARDLRVLVRERLVEGDSDQEVLDFVVARYGDFVLLTPPFKGITYALWFGPLAIVLAGIAIVLGFYRRSRAEAGSGTGAPAALSADEKRRLERLLDDGDDA